jgi:hypothetical protein
MNEATLENKLTEWNSWLGTDPNAEATIYKELIDLSRIRHIFQGVAEMVRENEQVQQHSLFHEVFSLNYAHSVLMYLRRQVQPAGVSMHRLLRDLKEHHSLVTRDWYVHLYTDGKNGLLREHAERSANSVFSRYCACSEDDEDMLDPSLVQEDIDRLQDIRESICDFVNWRVAHAVMNEPEQVPTYEQLDEWADTLEVQFKKYLLLLQGSGMNGLMPVINHDWRAIFRVPWLPPKDST